MEFMKLYTKTVCPKCIFIKSEIYRLGVATQIINMDEDEEARQYILDKGIMAAPVLEWNGIFFTDTQDIIEVLEENS